MSTKGIFEPQVLRHCCEWTFADSELKGAAREDKWKWWDDMHHLTKVNQSAGLSYFSSTLLRDRYDNLFQAPQGDVMMTSLVLLGLLTHAQNECTHQLALLWGTRHLISPE